MEECHLAGIPEWSRMSIIEASHFSAGTAYVAANRYQMDDMRPYIYKTTDYGGDMEADHERDSPERVRAGGARGS